MDPEHFSDETSAKIWRIAARPAIPGDTDAFYARLQGVLDNDTMSSHDGQLQRPRSRMSHRTRILAVVGAAAIVCAVTGIALTRVTQHEPSARARTYHTQPGQTATVRLADASTVMLAPATSVVMTPQGARVTGEAYFTISAQSSRPFVVQTRDATVHVLGTRFSVRQYPDEPHSRVVVDDGKVTLRPLMRSATVDRPTVVSARMVAQITDSGVTTTSNLDTRAYTAWTHGSLIFDGVALRDALTELARAYGTTIRVEDRVLAKQPLVIEVSVQNQPLTQVLDLIGLTMNAHYIRNGSGYELSPGAGATPRAIPGAIPNAPRQRFPQPEKQYGK